MVYEMRKHDGGMALSHAKAVSAPRAWAWKTVVPSSKELELTDAQYCIAARLNLHLLPVEGAASLPDDCPFCDVKGALRGQLALRVMQEIMWWRGEPQARRCR